MRVPTVRGLEGGQAVTSSTPRMGSLECEMLQARLLKMDTIVQFSHAVLFPGHSNRASAWKSALRLKSAKLTRPWGLETALAA